MNPQTVKSALQLTNILIALGCFATIALVVSKRSVKVYGYFVGLLAVRGANAVSGVLLLFHRKELGLALQPAYKFYVYSYWTSSSLQSILQVLIIYAVYRSAMKPLDGLKRIGTVIFRWVSSVALLLSVVVALGPHDDSGARLGTLLGQAQQGVSILTVCLLLFVCFAARPLGLTFRSRMFGVTLGLGVNSTATLILAAWLSTSQAHSLYSPIYLAGSIASCLTLGIWATYFALPEPARKMITLPTTSPYFLWNKISEALGDDPGEVVVAGFTPDMLAPAELTAMIAASVPVPEETYELPSHAMAASF